MPNTPAYRPRIVDAEIAALVAGLPAVLIEGPKAVGKTATASRLAATVRRLDVAGELDVARADPSRALGGTPPVLLDEWQRLPELWDLVRRAVDGAPRATGRFLLTGSASSAGAGTHSGAGRIVSLRMRPLSLAERVNGARPVSLATLLTGARGSLEGNTGAGLQWYVEEILASGFPGLRGLGERPLLAQLDGYLDRVVDRDFPELGHQLRNPAALRRWMTAYAAASSTTTSFEKIRDAATAGHGDKPAKTTTMPYRDVLERLWLVDPVPAWAPTRNRIARLSSPPKHQLADPALAARLLGVDAGALTGDGRGGPAMGREGTLVGALFESLVTLSVRVYAQAAEARVHHLRTARGEREIDLIVERADGRVVAIGVKLAHDVDDRDVRHLAWLRSEIGDDVLDAIVVTTGDAAYRRRDGIGVVPAVLLGP